MCHTVQSHASNGVGTYYPNGNPAFMPFTVSQSSSPAALPTPGGTVGTIEFGFRGPSVLHRGDLVRFENDGYLVHVVVGIQVKNRAVASAETTALRAGKDKLAMRLASGIVNFVATAAPSAAE